MITINRQSGTATFTGRELLSFNVLEQSWRSVSRSPFVRFHHASVLLGNFLLFHGGYLPNDSVSASGPKDCYFDDLHYYDLCTLFFFFKKTLHVLCFVCLSSSLPPNQPYY